MSGQDDLDEMAAFVNDHDLAEFEHFADRGGTLWQAFQITAQPSFVFINDSGEMARQVGGLTDAQLVEQLELLLQS